MASPPEVRALTGYERLRAEKLRRNEAILASVRRKADELSAGTKSSEPPAVRRRSILLSQPPPDAQPDLPNPTPSGRRAPKSTPYQRRAPNPVPSQRRAPEPLPPTPTPTPPALRSTTFSSSLSQPPPDAQPALPNPTPSGRRDRKPAVSRRRAQKPPKPLPPTPATPRSTTISATLASTILEAVSLSPGAARHRAADGFDAGKELVLKPANVRKLLPNRIPALLVLPLVDRTVVAAGNILGNVGFWHADREPQPGVVEAGGVFEYLPHRGPVAGIVAHPAMPHKVYSCSHEGEICLMDIQKENFNIVHSCEYPVYALCQAPDSASCLYFGGRNGKMKLFDERMGKVTTAWDSHDNAVNSIDFHPEKKHMLATSSTDKTARIWDLRRLKNKEEDCLKVLGHDFSVQSAYFSPSGRILATTGLDDTVRVFEGDEFDCSHIIKHNNQTGRWISSFKAIWGWNDTDLFIGNMKRAIDIISVGSTSHGVLSASKSACLESKHMKTIPCRFSAHPYRVGHLACASSGGVFLWTRA